MGILSSAAGDGASATLFVEEEEEGRKIPVETRSVRIAFQEQQLLLRPRSTGSKREKKTTKKICGRQCKSVRDANADPGKNLAKEPHAGGAAAAGARRRMVMMCFCSFLWRNLTKKPKANQSGGVALLLLSPGSGCNQTNGGRVTRARSNKARFAQHRSATAPPAGRLDMANIPCNGDNIEIGDVGSVLFLFSLFFHLFVKFKFGQYVPCQALPEGGSVF